MVASEVMVGGTCISSLIVVNTSINQLKIKVSPIAILCLRLLIVVYKQV